MSENSNIIDVNESEFNDNVVEAAMNWVLEHSGDPDFSFPFVNPRYCLIKNHY